MDERSGANEYEGYGGSDYGDNSRSAAAGRWTNEEHRLFLQGLQLHQKQWKAIADLVKTRTVVQIRTHAQKYFQKLDKGHGSSSSSSAGTAGSHGGHTGKDYAHSMRGMSCDSLDTTTSDSSEEVDDHLLMSAAHPAHSRASSTNPSPRATPRSNNSTAPSPRNNTRPSRATSTSSFTRDNNNSSEDLILTLKLKKPSSPRKRSRGNSMSSTSACPTGPTPTPTPRSLSLEAHPSLDALDYLPWDDFLPLNLEDSCPPGGVYIDWHAEEALLGDLGMIIDDMPLPLPLPAVAPAPVAAPTAPALTMPAPMLMAMPRMMVPALVLPSSCMSMPAHPAAMTAPAALSPIHPPQVISIPLPPPIASPAPSAGIGSSSRYLHHLPQHRPPHRPLLLPRPSEHVEPATVYRGVLTELKSLFTSSGTSEEVCQLPSLRELINHHVPLPGPVSPMTPSRKRGRPKKEPESSPYPGPAPVLLPFPGQDMAVDVDELLLDSGLLLHHFGEES